MSPQFPDRRHAQRVDANLKLSVQVPLADGTKADASLETINISSSGVYFKSNHFIEPMTKLEMELELAVPPEKGSTEAKIATVHCQGIVVRVTPDSGNPPDGEWEIAVFFTSIESGGHRALERHIAYLLETVQ